MRAQVGDQLLAESGNTGLILEVLGHDGHPPYVVRWHRSGHIAMVSPGQYARIIDGRGLIFLREVLARDTAAELVIEAFYPADPATTQALEAAHRAEPPRRPTPSGTSETAVT